MVFIPRSHTARGAFRLAAAPDDAFPLFSPLGEKAWAPGWDPEILFPAGADWEEGMVWRTPGEIIWFVAKLDRSARRVTYHRVDGRDLAVTIQVAVDGTKDRESEVRVTYTWIGLTDGGNEQVANLAAASFAAKMQEWQRLIIGALATHSS